MKIQFLKDFNSNKEGDVLDVNDDRARYWINVRIASAVTDNGELTAPVVIELIKSATTLKELNKLVKGEERKTVLDAYDKKHAEIKGV